LASVERQLLSLKLALHQASGFNTPIVMDAPLARMSDEMRENLAKILLEINKDRQMILLLTTTEYSPEVRKHLDRSCSNKFTLKSSANGYGTDVEDLE